MTDTMPNTDPKKASLLESAGRPRLAGPYRELDLSVIEASARRVRSEYLATLLRRLFDWLAQGAHRSRQRRIEQYLANATDLADVEHRMRVLARRGSELLG
jgi:hypothetical protein